jgi:hypothetical protein
VRGRLAALAALAALAGCGDDELEKFRDDLRPLEQRAEEQRSMTSGLLRSVRLGSRADARGVRAQAATLSVTYDEIAAVEPPDDYAEAFAEYVQANRASVRDLRRLAAEVEAGDLRGVRQASDSVLSDLSRARTSSLKWVE